MSEMRMMLQSERIIQNPNLPENDVSRAAVGERYTETISALYKIGIKALKIKGNSALPDYLNFHADMNIFHYSENTFYCNEFNSIENEKYSDTVDFLKITQNFASDYPGDSLLNAVRLGNHLICNPKTVSKDILEKAYNDGLNIINVNQGYTKCSICIVNSNALITDDASIYNSIKKTEIDVLFISKGSVRLETKDYGFIGGCTGLAGKNKILFNGRVESHSDCNLIIDFLNQYNMNIIELTDERLTDIGSILPLTESF